MKQIKKTRQILFLLAAIMIILCLNVTVFAEPVVGIKYVFLDYSGEYTGQADSNKIPFGFGIFISNTPIDGELWHYVGQWQDGCPEGEGAIYFENGSMLKGTFSNGILINGLAYTVNGLTAASIKVEKTLPESNETKYIGNKKSLRFHYPDCRSVKQMKDSNKVEFSSREEAIERNYVPCGDCNP